MSRRKRKIHDPADLARQHLEAANRKADRDRLGSQEGVVLNAEAPGMPTAVRQDCFAQLYHAIKPALTMDQYNAARRLEKDLAVSIGAGGAHSLSGPVVVREDGSGPFDRLMAASDRVKAVQPLLGAYWFDTLCALIMPPLQGKSIRWREVIEAKTKETDSRNQTAMVRQACKVLAEAYVDLDYRRKAA